MSYCLLRLPKSIRVGLGFFDVQLCASVYEFICMLRQISAGEWESGPFKDGLLCLAEKMPMDCIKRMFQSRMCGRQRTGDVLVGSVGKLEEGLLETSQSEAKITTERREEVWWEVMEKEESKAEGKSKVKSV